MARTAEPPAKLLAAVEAIRQKRGLSRRELAAQIGIPDSTMRAWYAKRPRPPSGANLLRLSEFIQEGSHRPLEPKSRPSVSPAIEARLPLQPTEARARATRVKVLLELLAEELGWFRDGSAESREVFRSRLDAFDAGYVSSLVTMLFDEDKFKRWLELSTNRPRLFKRASG